MNLLIITGRLGKDAVLRYTSTGKSVLSFNVAVNSGWGDHKRTTWINCHIWGERAVKLDEKKCFTKGLLLSIKGEASARAYESKTGAAASLECRVDDFEFLSASSKGDTSSQEIESSSISDFTDLATDDLEQLPYYI